MVRTGKKSSRIQLQWSEVENHLVFIVCYETQCEWMSTWKHTPQREVSFRWALTSRVVGHHHTEPLSSHPQRLITASVAKVNIGEVS